MRRNYVYDEDDAVPIRTKRKKPSDSSHVQVAKKPNKKIPQADIHRNAEEKTAVGKTYINKRTPHADSNVSGARKSTTAVKPEDKSFKKSQSTANVNYTSDRKAKKPSDKGGYGYSVKNRTHSKSGISFKVSYLIFVAVLLAVSVGIVIYVHGALVDYENSQPENILQSQINLLEKAESVEEINKIMSVNSLKEEFSASDEDILNFKSEFLAGTLSFKENHGSVDASKKVLDVISNGYKVATFTLEHVGQETKLLIFTLDRWKIAEFTSCGYEVNFTSPISVTVKNKGETVVGENSDDLSKTVYDIKTLSKPDIEIYDVLGNSVKYDSTNLPKFTDYKITVPSNFTVKGKDTLPLDIATLTPIDSLKYVKEYCNSVPDTATYVISIMGGEPNFRIYDNNGDEVSFELEGRKVEIDVQSGKDENPLDVDIDPLEVAKLWSFFMTQDLTGKTNGYYQISPYLIDGSYLQGVAWKWATGIDITFTSTHTLENPPFCTEKISNFVKYSDDCFSCDILLEKNMHLSTGMTVKDTINSTFYFVKYDDTDNGIDDAHWVFVDYKEIQ